jgi:benzoate membrane transport protein
MIPLFGILINAIKYASYAEICGAFLISGIVIVILGITGATKKILAYLPMPVVMGMVAGALFSLTLPMFTTAKDMPLVWVISIVAFFIVLMIPKLDRNFPAALFAMILGLIALTATGQTSWNQMSVPTPTILFQMPEFSIRAVLGMTIPTLALFLGLNTIQAAGSLKLNGYNPPVTSMTVICGFATIVGSFLCSFPCSPAGPTTAMLSGPASGKKMEGRYVAAFITSILQILFAVFIMALVSLTYCVPAAFISCIAALAMVDVTMSALRSAFSGGFKLGAVIAFLITMSGIVFLGIGGAFWGLVGGILVSALVERDEFKAFINATKKENEEQAQICAEASA